jgi:hypothetical protein
VRGGLVWLALLLPDEHLACKVDTALCVFIGQWMSPFVKWLSFAHLFIVLSVLFLSDLEEFFI